MDPLRELLAEFGFEFDTASALAAASSIEEVVSAASAFGAELLTGGVVAAAAYWVTTMAEVGAELDDVSQRLQMSATEVTEWHHAAQLSGVAASELDRAILATARAAATGGAALRAIGVETRDAGGQARTTGQIFESTIDALASMSDEGDRAAAAQRIFGRNASALAPLLRQGADGIHDLRAEVRRLYGTDLERLAELGAEVGDEQDRLNLVWDAMRTRLAVLLLPALSSVLEAFLSVGTVVNDLIRGSSILEVVAGALGVALAAAAISTIGVWGPAAATFGVVALAIGAVLLLVEDLVTMFRGGRSVIGDFIDELFGVGSARQVVQYLTDAWEGLKLTITDTTELARNFMTDAASLFASLGGSFSATPQIQSADGSIRQATAEETAAIRADPTVTAGLRPVSVQTTRQVGQIIVQGATDPEETARRVQETFERGTAADADITGADLVPEGA